LQVEQSDNMEPRLAAIANKIRLETFKAIAHAGGGHFGGSLSESEILAVLYFSEMNIDPCQPDMAGRDRFILSKGHGGPGLYTTLALRGFFPKEWLAELDKNGSRLPKHIDRFKLPGLDVSSGALGQGLSVATGMALAARLDGSSLRIYTVMGDGECNEGQVWEAGMTAAKYHLDNLAAIIDQNGGQVDGACCAVMPTESLEAKWSAFGWQVFQADGHNVHDLQSALAKARECRGRPSMIIASTIKGKGVSFMESQYQWHSGSMTPEQYRQALSELERRVDEDAG
jgi:transketolase